jgi:NADH-quinone oxidoreductase subunit N
MVVAAGAKSGLWFLLVALALNSAVGLYYYLRILLSACRPVAAPLFHPLSASDGLMLGGVTVLSLLLGVFPAPVFDLIRSLVAAGVP